MRHLKYLLLLALLSMAAGVQAQSPDTPASRINAISCEILPKPLAIDVLVLDNAKTFVKFKSLFEKELRAKGVELSNTAALIATLDIRTVRELPSDPKDPTFQRRFGREDPGIFQDSTQFRRGNVWSNKSGSLLGGPKGELQKFSLNQLHVSVSINRRKGGFCLWQGEVLHDLHGDEDPNAITLKIIPVLARALGKTIRNKPMNIIQ
jgi:hypothetical protein